MSSITWDVLNPDAPATHLFPAFENKIYQMVKEEVTELDAKSLDYESQQWNWSKWSIRRNLSHIASGDYRWLWERWGKTLFPSGLDRGSYIDDLLNSPYDRRLDETKYWELDTLLDKLKESLVFAQGILERETVKSCRSREIQVNMGGNWTALKDAGFRGIRSDDTDSEKYLITLEMTFVHRYFEYIAHTYNIQRLKLAQGIAVYNMVPVEGYLALPGWDISVP